MHQAQSGAERAGGEVQRLDRATRPALPLHEKGIKAFRRQSNRQRFAEIAGDVSLAQQDERQQDVFRNGLGRQGIAHRAECCTTRDGVGTTTKGTIPAVARGHGQQRAQFSREPGDVDTLAGDAPRLAAASSSL